MTASVRVAALLAATVVLSACRGGGGVATSSPSPAAVTGSAPAESAVARATMANSSATPGPSPTSASSIAPRGTPAPVPRAEVVTAGAAVAGTLGTYSVDGSGSDSPWLPFGTLPAVGVGATERLTVRFVDGSAISDVQVLIAEAADTTGSATRGVDGGSLDVGGTSFRFGPLPAGRWVVAARIFRADGRGNGLTFWAITVR